MATNPAQRFDSGKASRRFISNAVWMAVICSLLLLGQGLRYHFVRAQLDEIRAETDKLYVSVLGRDIGTQPFGRLQFEHGKLTAKLRIGLDPLSVLAALSRPAGENLRLEELSLEGKRGTVHGFFGPNTARFDEYMNKLSDDEQYLFSLQRREDVFGGITFSLIVEPR